MEAAGLPADPSAYRAKGAGLKLWLILGAVVVWTVLCVGGALYIADLGRKAAKGEAAPISIPFVTHAPEPAPVPAAEPATPQPDVVAGPVEGSAALAARLDRLEGEQRRTAQAAASALAAASLAEAAQGPTPFEAELAAVAPLLPPSADLAALQRSARRGAPTRATLAVEFGEAAGAAAQAAHAPADGDGFLARFGHALASVVSIRRVEVSGGSGPDAMIARAQKKLDDGDLAAALAEVDKLPTASRTSLAPWRERAQRRLDIDREVATLRTAAMRDLSASAGAR